MLFSHKMLYKKIILILVILLGCLYYKNANAQLWSYIGYTPAKEKAFEKYLKKETYKVVAHQTLDEDKLPYDEMIYRLQSLDSTTCYIHVMQVPFTKTLTITTTSDSLKIQDCVGPARLHLLRKDLFEIVYSPRGGSDDGYDNVLLLAVRNGKFRIAMEIESMHDYDGPGFFGLEETHLTLVGETPQKYQLTLKNHALRRYYNKAKNFDHYQTYILKYNSNLNLFYSTYETVNGFLYNDSGNKNHVSGRFPVIKLGEAKYCYINDYWYAIGIDPENSKATLVNYCYRPESRR